MDTKILPKLNGIVGLCVLGLFAAALITGQVGAQSSSAAPAAGEKPLAAYAAFDPEQRDIAQQDALLQFMDLAMSMPVRVEIDVNGNRMLFESGSSATQHRPGQ